MLGSPRIFVALGVLIQNRGKDGNNIFWQKKVYMAVSPFNAKASLCLFICQIFKKLAGQCWSPSTNQEQVKSPVNRRLKLLSTSLYLWMNMSDEDIHAKIINPRSFLRKERSKKISLDPWFSFYLLKSYVLKFFTVGHGKRTIHWKLLIKKLAKCCLLVNW